MVYTISFKVIIHVSRALGNVLWYIDGRHHVFSDRSFKIPKFHRVYNAPEASKHCKRSLLCHPENNGIMVMGLPPSSPAEKTPDEKLIINKWWPKVKRKTT